MQYNGKRHTAHFLPILLPTVLLLAALCAGCGIAKGYRTISMDKAAEILASEENEYLLVDVRTQEEYDKAHIPGAILLPIEDIRDGKLDALPDKEQAIMIYCWTGRRAADSCEILADLGYENLVDIGGFIDWKGESEDGGENAESGETEENTENRETEENAKNEETGETEPSTANNQEDTEEAAQEKG